MKQWETELQRYGRIAYETGKELKFAVIKREGKRNWRIYLQEIVIHGEDEVDDEII